jgi:cell fate (sporulation/competence/biofilm development) regulator YmcA (YheA/YmcA/DUF963 family)
MSLDAGAKCWAQRGEHLPKVPGKLTNLKQVEHRFMSAQSVEKLAEIKSMQLEEVEKSRYGRGRAFGESAREVREK